jgi:hypothetical protein
MWVNDKEAHVHGQNIVKMLICKLQVPAGLVFHVRHAYMQRKQLINSMEQSPS